MSNHRACAWVPLEWATRDELASKCRLRAALCTAGGLADPWSRQRVSYAPLLATLCDSLQESGPCASSKDMRGEVIGRSMFSLDAGIAGAAL